MLGILAQIVTVNGNIDAGSLIAAASIIITLVMLHAANVRRITKIETRVEALWAYFMSIRDDG